jgi:hypothetical protein
MPAGLSAGAVLRAVRDARAAARKPGALVVSGPLAEQLARDLATGGDGGAIRLGGDPAAALAVIVVAAGDATDAEIDLARRATRELVPVIAVQLDPASDPELPYVLATDVVPCPPGQGFPVEAVARALTRRLGSSAAGLAARLPALREGITAELTRQTSVRNALVALLPLSGSAHLPVLTLNQLRLALALGVANGREPGPESAPEAGAVLVAAPALRSLARRAVRTLPIAPALVQAAIAYAGTRAVGEAAARRTAAD